MSKGYFFNIALNLYCSNNTAIIGDNIINIIDTSILVLYEIWNNEKQRNDYWKPYCNKDTDNQLRNNSIWTYWKNDWNWITDTKLFIGFLVLNYIAQWNIQ